MARAAGLSVIFCIGETLQEREEGELRVVSESSESSESYPSPETLGDAEEGVSFSTFPHAPSYSSSRLPIYLSSSLFLTLSRTHCAGQGGRGRCACRSWRRCRTCWTRPTWCGFSPFDHCPRGLTTVKINGQIRTGGTRPTRCGGVREDDALSDHYFDHYFTTQISGQIRTGGTRPTRCGGVRDDGALFDHYLTGIAV